MAELQDNPLLIQRIPIQFSAVKAEHIEPAVYLLLDQMKRRLHDISEPGVPRTFRDIVLALDTITEPLDFAMSVVRHMESVVTTPELRNAYNSVQGPVSMFYTSIALDEKLWMAIKAVDASVDKSALSPVHRRYLHKTVTGFRRAGADLDEAGKKKLEELDVALTKATTKFSQNVLDATNAFDLIVTRRVEARRSSSFSHRGCARKR